jgi:Domain of unknown function (DUF4349)
MNAHAPSAARGPRALLAFRRTGPVLLVLAALAVGACAGSATSDVTIGPAGGTGKDAEAPMPVATAAPAEAWGAADTQAAGGRALGTSGTLVTPGALDTPDGPLIVRTGQLDLEVAVLDDALAAAEKAVAAAGGYVAASQRQGDGERAGASVTYRIPADRWEATLAALRSIGTKVLAEQTASEEVTSQVVDLGARLVNLRTTEAALQAIMAKATKISDILEVQAQLTTVRGEIEQLTAQKQALEKQAALATLTVGFALPPVVAVTQVREGWDPAADVDRAAATLVGLGQGVASAIIWAVIVVLPLALLLGLAIGLAWLIARRVRPRSTPPAPPATIDAPAA